MNLRKNVGAKAGVVVASVVALLAAWGLVHQNPPPAKAADTPAAAPTTTAPRARTRASAPAAPARTKRTTRTHAS
ncbi:MAG: hypothetical protein M3P30_07495 [Chloroflexota bacterium]|nr:hypothetical protein [Chloroflexota bacterium]